MHKLMGFFLFLRSSKEEEAGVGHSSSCLLGIDHFDANSVLFTVVKV